MSRSLRPVFAVALLAVGGCASPEVPSATQDAPPRWLLTWYRPLAADAAGVARFEADAAALAGVPVRYLAAASDRVVAVALDCASEAHCQAARDRLRADPRVVDIQPDARRRTHAPRAP